MAINLLGASNARLDFGDIAAIGGLTAITVSITHTPSALASNLRLIGQWNGGFLNAGFLVATQDTDELAFILGNSNNSAQWKGRKTTGLNLTAGATYRSVYRWSAASNSMSIWVNGVNQTVATFIADANPATIGNVTESVQVGHETASGTDGLDGDFSEIAIHGVDKGDSYAVAYGKGYSPKFYRDNGILYCRAINTNYLIDEWGGRAVTNVSGTTAAHPPVIMPKRRTIIQVPAAGGGGGFQAAWARGSNVILQPGIAA